MKNKCLTKITPLGTWMHCKNYDRTNVDAESVLSDGLFQTWSWVTLFMMWSKGAANRKGTTGFKGQQLGLLKGAKALFINSLVVAHYFCYQDGNISIGRNILHGDISNLFGMNEMSCFFLSN